jgi:peptidyl-prolyl cis-trans isomerase A (cyclophilin A)
MPRFMKSVRLPYLAPIVAVLLLVAACEKREQTGRGVSRSDIEGTPAQRGARPSARAKAGTRAPTAADLAAYTQDLPGDGPLTATIETAHGTIHCELAADKAPITVANFVGLATGKHAWWDPRTKRVMTGTPFFDGLTFHRVIPDFMIQGGDPLGSGAGDAGYAFADELHKSLRHDRPGILSMANSGPATNGSQFFITEKPTPHLDDKHSVFGVCQEIDVVKAIARAGGPTVMKKVTITKGLPK